MTGIILAGGQSRRMGTDKALLPWNGGTFLSAMVDKLTSVCREIIVVGRPRMLARAVRWTTDRYCGVGPLAGLHAGLLETRSAGALVVPCDMPLLPVGVLEQLAALAKQADVVLPVHAQGCEPLCAWYSRTACLPVITQLLERGCTCPLDIFPQVRLLQVDMAAAFPNETPDELFANINFPGDYVRAEQRARQPDPRIVGE